RSTSSTTLRPASTTCWTCSSASPGWAPAVWSGSSRRTTPRPGSIWCRLGRQWCRSTWRIGGRCRSIPERESEVDEIVRQTVDVLHDRVEHYSWVGIYFVEESDLVLGPWRGPAATEHVRIPVGQGVCGAAAASGRTEIVD